MPVATLECSTGNKPCGGRCIDEEWDCKTEGSSGNTLRSSAPQPSLRSPALLPVAAMSGGVLTSAFVAAGAKVAFDLNRTSRKKSGRYPPGGVPDEISMATYDKFTPGSLIRKEFCAGGLGCRHHYGVYVGKEDGGHQVIDLSRDDGVIRQKGINEEVDAGDADWEAVPKSEMSSSGLSRDDVIARAKALSGTKIAHGAFISNCESVARGIVEGKAYSSQGNEVDKFTRNVGSFVAVLGQPFAGYDLRQASSAINAVNKIKDVGGHGLKTPRSNLIDFVFRGPRQGNQDSLPLYGDAIALLLRLSNMKRPEQFAADVADRLSSHRNSPLAKEAKVQLYSAYIMAIALLVNNTLVPDDSRNDAAEHDCEKGKSCKGRCIPKDWECREESGKSAAQSSSLVKRASQGVSDRATRVKQRVAVAGRAVGTGAKRSTFAAGAGFSAIGLGGSVIAIDLLRSAPKSTGRYPKDGKPDETSFKTYDTFQPGDLIRKEFCVPPLGCRHHYGVYVGKSDEGKHELVDMGRSDERISGGKFVPKMLRRGLTDDHHPINSDWEVVPESEMKKKASFTRDQIVERANALVGVDMINGGFIGNCETVSRGIVEGNAWSSQGDTVSRFTKDTLSLGAILLQKVTFDTQEVISANAAINSIAHVGGAGVKTPKKYLVDFMYPARNKPKKRSSKRGDSASQGQIDRLMTEAGIMPPREFAQAVEAELKKYRGPVAKEARIQFYTPYIAAMALIINRMPKRRADSLATDLTAAEERPPLPRDTSMHGAQIAKIVRNLVIRAMRKGVSEVVQVRIGENGLLSGVVRDEQGKHHSFTIDQKRGQISTNQLVSFEDERLDSTKHECKVGKECGNRCIPKAHTCRQSLRMVASETELRDLRQSVETVSPQVSEVSEEDEIDRMSIREMKKEASRSGVIGYSEMTKPELATMLKLYRKSPKASDRIQRSIESRKKRQTNLKKIARGESTFKTWRQVSRALALTKRDKGLARDAAAAVVMGIGFKGWLEAKKRYEGGLKESATTALERSEKINAPYVKGNNITFVVGNGPDNTAESMVNDLRTADQLPDAEKGDAWFQGHHMVALESTSDIKSFKGNSKLPNGRYNPAYLGHRVVDGLRRTISGVSKKRNPDAVELAANVAAFANKRGAKGGYVNAGKRMAILAHGASGNTAREAVDIISKMPDGNRILNSLSVVNMGTPDVGLHSRGARSETTLTSRNDPFSKFSVRGELPVNSVAGDRAHDYLSSLESIRAIKRELGGSRSSAVSQGRTKKRRRRK